jgi:hypothetical protein
MYKALFNPRTGRFAGVVRRNPDGSDTSFGAGSREWTGFLKWNAVQPVPLDIEDRALDPVPEDADKSQLDALLAKDPQAWTAAELRQAVALVLKRIQERM